MCSQVKRVFGGKLVNSQPVYAQTIAVSLTSGASALIAVYSDHSIYNWDITDMKKVHMSNSGAIAVHVVANFRNSKTV